MALTLLALALGKCFVVARRGLLAAAVVATPAWAISGGGKDYASSTLTQSFKGAAVGSTRKLDGMSLGIHSCNGVLCGNQTPKCVMRQI